MIIRFSVYGRDYWGWVDNAARYHREDLHPALNLYGAKYCFINGEAE
jgi:hypothetical protein